MVPGQHSVPLHRADSVKQAEPHHSGGHVSTESLTTPELQAALDFLNRSIDDLSSAKRKLQLLPPLCANSDEYLEKYLCATLPLTSEHCRVLRFLDPCKFSGKDHWIRLSIPEMEFLCVKLSALLPRTDLIESWGDASRKRKM